MKVVVCGSRVWDNRELLFNTLDDTFHTRPLDDGSDFILIHGGAKGADTIAASWVVQTPGVTVEVYRPDWSKYGRSAAFIRNDTMLDLKPDLVVAFHKNNSPGTQYMIKGALKRKLDLKVVHE